MRFRSKISVVRKNELKDRTSLLARFSPRRLKRVACQTLEPLLLGTMLKDTGT